MTHLDFHSLTDIPRLFHAWGKKTLDKNNEIYMTRKIPFSKYLLSKLMLRSGLERLSPYLARSDPCSLSMLNHMQ